MGTRHSRRFKIDWIFNRIKASCANGSYVKEKSLIGEFAIRLASRRETALEILRDLEDARMIIRSYGEIITPEAEKQMKTSDEDLVNEHEAQEEIENVGK